MVEKTTLDDALDDLGDRDYLVPFDLWKSEGRGAYESWAEVVAAARSWHALTNGQPSQIYDGEGHVHEPVRLAVEAAIKRYPNMDAEQWIGGVAAIRTVLDALTVTPTPDD